ncbi:MAG: PD-(D/E)XK nuclease family protein [Gemmatimonadota bacterium]|nr:PD-(D/E)XK nuclease family protein [Gemmatimonadota bacterium]
MSDNYHNYQLLLAKAAQLYERHGIGLPDPFNVFSSLKNKNGYLNETLHSRFLCTLLDYKNPIDETRQNLKDFLRHIGVKDFELCSVKVEPECDGIDILIINADKKAVVIENKSNPQRGDEDKQLWRYYNTLKGQGYSDIRLLYLTPDGHEPSDDSVGNLDRKRIKCISYEDLIPWLESCRERDENEAALQDAVAQYLQLVREMTGTDGRRKYMDDLKELCLKDNNFVLIQDLRDAMGKVETELRKKMWDEIESELKSEIQNLRDKDSSYNGLCYRLSKSTSLLVAIHSRRIWFGVGCSKEKYKDKYDTLKNALEDVSGEKPRKDDHYPWWRYVDIYLDLSKPEDFRLLSNDAARQDYTKKAAQEIVEKGLKEVWEVLEDLALVNAIKEGEKTELVPEEQIFEILERIS